MEEQLKMEGELIMEDMPRDAAYGSDGKSSSRNGKQSGGDFLFFLFAAIGGLLIHYHGKIDFAYALYLPTGVVVLYSLMIILFLKRTSLREQAEHRIDSIYFLGFLFTLISLVSLFSLFSRELLGDDADLSRLAMMIFPYLGISVSTSIAGVLFRNILRGWYLSREAKKSGGEEPGIDNSEELLRAIAETLKPMKEYLAERGGKLELLANKEDAYLASLSRFIEATDSFSGNLESSNQLLQRQLTSFADTLGESEEALQRMNRMSASLEDASLQMDTFSRGTKELNTVLDGLLVILDEKVREAV